MPRGEVALYGVDVFGEPIVPQGRGPLGQRFVVPPFSVLDARSGFWRSRKRAWISMGIKGELGRADAPVYGGNISNRSALYRARERGETVEDEYTYGEQPSRSIFDPVLCELVYRWFCPARGQVVDPFAGGSVRGVVAALLGRSYWGCDLSAEQIKADRVQGEEVCPDAQPTWVVGDALRRLRAAPRADLIFTCPPYGNLERYSDDPRDLSTMGYDEFERAYRRIIRRAARRLKPDRFACIVVADFRDDSGYYQGFVSDTIDAFCAAGLNLYNAAILVSPAGSLPIRVTRYFVRNRKLGKCHQQILVFVKGNWRRASRACSLTRKAVRKG